MKRSVIISIIASIAIIVLDLISGLIVRKIMIGNSINTASIVILGGADGPTSIFISDRAISGIWMISPIAIIVLAIIIIVVQLVTLSKWSKTNKK